MILSRVLAVALAMALTVPAARAASLSANYDFYVSGIKVGTVSLATEESASSYSARAKVGTAGLLGAFLSFTYDGTAQGALGRGGPVPSLFTATSVTSGKKKTARIDWTNGAPAKVTVNPPRDVKFDPANLKGSLDPVSAAFAVLRDGPAERMCSKKIDLFDGSRRSRLTVGPRRAEAGGFSCAGSYARLEGEAQSLTPEGETAFTIRFATQSDGTARVRRIETGTSFGTAALERRS